MFVVLFVCLVQFCEKAMLDYLPLCADNGRELTSVAFMCKKDQCTGQMDLVRLHLETYSFLGSLTNISQNLYMYKICMLK